MKAKRLSLLVSVLALIGSTGALAQSVGDQLIIDNPANTAALYSGTASPGAPGALEPPLGAAFISLLGSTQQVSASTLLGSLIGLTSTTYNPTTLNSWMTSISATGSELFLTDPGSTTISDVVLGFNATVTGIGSGTAIVLISDPTLVGAITALPHLYSFNSIAETGSLQNVSAYLPTSSLIGSIQVLSAVPEPQTYALLLSGFVVIAFVARRRRRTA